MRQWTGRLLWNSVFSIWQGNCIHEILKFWSLEQEHTSWHTIVNRYNLTKCYTNYILILIPLIRKTFFFVRDKNCKEELQAIKSYLSFSREESLRLHSPKWFVLDNTSNTKWIHQAVCMHVVGWEVYLCLCVHVHMCNNSIKEDVINSRGREGGNFGGVGEGNGGVGHINTVLLYEITESLEFSLWPFFFSQSYFSPIQLLITYTWAMSSLYRFLVPISCPSMVHAKSTSMLHFPFFLADIFQQSQVLTGRSCYSNTKSS